MTPVTRVAALFVDRRGPYWGRDDVDAWDAERWGGGPSARVKRILGDDNGCFESALASGGVLEHPEASHAFKRFDLWRPAKSGGWERGDPCLDEWSGGTSWVCCVEQGHYGHPARKATWLYYVGPRPPELIWGKSAGVRLDEGFHSKAERDAARAAGQKPVKRLSTVQNIVTPPAFAELLITLARGA
jgi:hypothetical protein